MNNKNSTRIQTCDPLHVVKKSFPEVEGLVFNRNSLSSKKVDVLHDVSYNHPSRWEVMERNLVQGQEFLLEQDRQLKLAGVLLDNFRKALTAFVEHKTFNAFKLHSQIFSCGIRDISLATYRGTSLFGHNTQAPLKFHICEFGERKVIEVTRGDLFGPALQAIVCGEGALPPSEALLLEATKEILELRALNSRQSAKVRRSHSIVLEKLEVLDSDRKSLLGNQRKSDFLVRKNQHDMLGKHDMKPSKVAMAKRLVDFFITSPRYSFFSFSQGR
jgi:hypothetical protein